MSNNEEFLDTKEVAVALGVHPETLKRAVREEGLTALRLGRGLKFKQSWIDAWLEGKTINKKAKAGGE